jgi:hypothetical protein
VTFEAVVELPQLCALVTCGVGHYTMMRMIIMICVLDTVTLKITVDDQLVELYADGVSKTFESGGWNVVRSVAVPRKTRVIAVKGVDVANVRNFCA